MKGIEKESNQTRQMESERRQEGRWSLFEVYDLLSTIEQRDKFSNEVVSRSSNKVLITEKGSNAAKEQRGDMRLRLVPRSNVGNVERRETMLVPLA